MKVCTDACVFGAWSDVKSAKRILDIGTGTGLLSLMAAQRNPEALIDGVEVEEDAFQQAMKNFQESPYSQRLTVHHTAIQDFFPECHYDCIISNPPFFQNDLKSPDGKTNTAHHAGTLNFDDLFSSVKRLLAPNGTFHLLLPVTESRVCEQIGQREYMELTAELLLAHKPGYKPFRRITSWQRGTREKISSSPPGTEQLYIFQENGKDYDPRFKDYLKAFYLGF